MGRRAPTGLGAGRLGGLGGGQPRPRRWDAQQSLVRPGPPRCTPQLSSLLPGLAAKSSRAQLQNRVSGVPAPALCMCPPKKPASSKPFLLLPTPPAYTQPLTLHPKSPPPTYRTRTAVAPVQQVCKVPVPSSPQNPTAHSLPKLGPRTPTSPPSASPGWGAKSEAPSPGVAPRLSSPQPGHPPQRPRSRPSGRRRPPSSPRRLPPRAGLRRAALRSLPS